MPANSHLFITAVIVGIFGFGVSTLGAKEYYVSTTGHDTAAGTKAKPWQSLAKANTALKAGDTVYLMKGKHAGLIQPARSGKKKKPITYRSLVPGKAIIAGEGEAGAFLVEVDYITIDGIIFNGENRFHYGIYIDKHADHITIRNCTIRDYRDPKNLSGYGICVASGGASSLLIENCKIFRCGTTNLKREDGSNIHIYKNADHITIRNCDIYDSHTEDGLHFGAFGLVTDVLVENCRFWGNKENALDIKLVARAVVRNCTFLGPAKNPKENTGGGGSVVIHNGASDITIDNCRFEDRLQDGINGLSIQYNDENGGKAPPTQNITVQRSVFFGMKVGVLVVGGLPNQPMSGKMKNVKIYNNVFAKNKCGVELWAHPGGDVVNVDVRNNIFAANQDDLDFRADRIKEFTRGYNSYSRNVPKAEKHSRQAKPMFVDAKRHDYRIKKNSPLRNAGVDVGLPFRGKAPDLGAYEIGGKGSALSAADPARKIGVMGGSERKQK